MLDIIGKNVKVWVNEHEGRNGKFQTYTVSISRKDAEGKYINKPVKFYIGKTAWKPDWVTNGSVIDFKGFPTLDIYTDKEGNERKEVAIYASEIIWDRQTTEWGKPSEDSFEEAEEEIPF